MQPAKKSCDRRPDSSHLYKGRKGGPATVPADLNAPETECAYFAGIVIEDKFAATADATYAAKST